MPRPLPLLALLACLSCPCLAQIHDALTALDRRGISLAFQLYTDALAGPPAIASAPHATSFQFMDLSADIQLAKLVPAPPGTRVFFSVHANGSATADFDGAAQSMAGLISDPGARLAELWLEYGLTQGLRLRIGKIDANPDFALVPVAGGFMNSSFGYDPTFYPLPNYTATSWGGELLARAPNRHLHLAAFAPPDAHGILLMGEFGLDWRPSGLDGNLSIGAWRITGKAPALAGLNRSGAQGAYLAGEQKIWRHARRPGKQEPSLAAFLQLGAAPAAFSTFTRHLGAGLVWGAPSARRDQDAAGVAVSRGRFTSDPAAGFNYSSETVLETYYRFQLVKSTSISPDLQYVIHPGGVPGGHNAFAVGFRMSFSLSSQAE